MSNVYRWINGRKQNDENFFCSTSTPRKGRPEFCVAVKITDTEVMVRDTKDESKITLAFNHGEW